MVALGAGTRRRLQFACRTSYSVLLCWLLSGCWSWAGPLTYLSLAISIISATMYFGLWQSNTWKIMYSSFFGSFSGAVVSLTWPSPALFVLLFFLGIVALNKISLWDQFAKIIGGLCFVISALSQASQPQSPVAVFGAVMLVVNIPAAITGITLLAPIPNLAATSCVWRVRIVQTAVLPCELTMLRPPQVNEVSLKLGEALALHLQAFCEPEYTELYESEAAMLASRCQDLLSALPSLAAHAEQEACLFPSLGGLAAAVRAFAAGAASVLVEAQCMRDAHSRIVANTTHAKYVAALEGSLREHLSLVRSLLALYAEAISSYPRGLWLTAGWGTPPHRAATYSAAAASADGDPLGGSIGTSVRPRSASSPYVSSLLAAGDRRAANYSPLDDIESPAAEKEQAPSDAPSPAAADTPADAGRLSAESPEEQRTRLELEASRLSVRLTASRAALLNRMQWAREKYSYFCAAQQQEQQGMLMEGRQPAGGDGDDDLPLDEDTRAELLDEHMTLCVRNLAPRGAVICRLLFVADTAKDMQAAVLRPAHAPFSLTASALQRAEAVSEYVLSCCAGLGRALYMLLGVYLGGYIRGLLAFAAHQQHQPHAPLGYASTVRRAQSWLSLQEYCGQLFSGFLHPVKIALAGTICALLVVVPSLRAANPHGSWAAVVVMIVRQDNVSSSYQRGLQRIEGTVIGSVFSFGALKLLSGLGRGTKCFYSTHSDFASRGGGDQEQCSGAYFALVVIAVVLWIGMCVCLCVPKPLPRSPTLSCSLSLSISPFLRDYFFVQASARTSARCPSTATRRWCRA
jgi:hypothetical protein